MTNDSTNRRRNMVLGSLVADAAALGLHWIYDQDHIRKIAPEAPEFRTPDAQNYAGVPSYFAHPTRIAGDLSQYGEQAMVMLRALLQNGGQYDATIYAAGFRAHYGYGGAYVGYIDHATRDTLDNFRRTEDAAHDRAATLSFDGDPAITRQLTTKALALAGQFSGDTLRQKFSEAIGIIHTDPVILAHGAAVLEAVQSGPQASGANDKQLPAISKLPPLVAAMADADDPAFMAAIISAVATTNNHPEAADFGQVCGAMMRAALRGGDLEACLQAAQAAGSATSNALLADAMARTDQDNNSVTRHFGMACDLDFGVPSAVHNLCTAGSFEQAVRQNIYAGGDTCGRAILVGAVMGALHGIGGGKGIPQAWLDQLRVRDAVAAMLERLLA